LKAKSAISRAFGGRIGWSSLGFAFSLLIVAVAGATLFRLFRNLEFGKVLGAIENFPLERLLAAGACVAGSYIALTFYDLFALRTIGRRTIPYRVAAFASFTSYTIGHNFGATIFTSGLVRLRIYSAWGLGVVDIAKIAFMTGLTYWLGNAFVLGSGLIYTPAAASLFNNMPDWSNRLIGIAALTTLAVYIGWLLPRPRLIGRANWRLTLPSAGATVIQIGIGTLDLCCVALAMFTLLPNAPAIGFISFVVIFITAMLLGIISHVPGSLGVIEAAVFIGLPQFPKEELLASLLIFRLMNFVLPVTLAASLYGLRECWILFGGTVGDRDRDACESRRS